MSDEVTAYYDTFAEESRLATGASRLEFERTKETSRAPWRRRSGLPS